MDSKVKPYFQPRLAPSRANSKQECRPMPPPAPVTMATFPSNRPRRFVDRHLTVRFMKPNITR